MCLMTIKQILANILDAHAAIAVEEDPIPLTAAIALSQYWLKQLTAKLRAYGIDIDTDTRV